MASEAAAVEEEEDSEEVVAGGERHALVEVDYSTRQDL